jgi:hypothetical protein
MHDSRSLITPRRDFLARVAGATAVIMAGSAVAQLAAASGVTIPRDQSGRALMSPDFDDSWTERVRAAKHRVVFDSPAVDDGRALEQATVFMDDYHEMFGTSDADTVPVVVLRHMGTLIAANDAIWEKYELGKLAKLNDPTTNEETKRNPFLRVAASGKYASIEPASALPALRARGVILLACNRALMHFAASEAKKRNLDLEATRAEFRTGLVPGVILQPSGIYAMIRAQEAGCGLVKST